MFFYSSFLQCVIKMSYIWRKELELLKLWATYFPEGIEDPVGKNEIVSLAAFFICKDVHEKSR